MNNFISLAHFIKLVQEPSTGLVQLIYSRLAVKRTAAGRHLFVFLDKHCLNYGQNWESGFLNGLKFAKVIILLMSNKVCSLYNICNVYININ